MISEKPVDWSKGPFRLCCGQQHWGVMCPDGKVMCSVCFSKVPLDKLHKLPDGNLEDVCQECTNKIYN